VAHTLRRSADDLPRRPPPIVCPPTHAAFHESAGLPHERFHARSWKARSKNAYVRRAKTARGYPALRTLDVVIREKNATTSERLPSDWWFVAAAIDHILFLQNDLRSMSPRQGRPGGLPHIQTCHAGVGKLF
jgi:hypothetical protein